MAEEVTNSFRTREFTSAITRPADTTTYAAGDVISDATGNAHFTLGATNDDNTGKPGRPGANSGTLNTLRLTSSANQTTKLDCELWIFRTDITNTADNAAFAPTDAEVATVIEVIRVASSDWIVGNAGSGASGNAVAIVRPNAPIVMGRTRNLFVQLVARNAYIPVSGEIFTLYAVETQD